MNAPVEPRCPRLIAIVDRPTCRAHGINWEDAALTTAAEGAGVVLLRAHDDLEAWQHLAWDRLRRDAPGTTWLVAGAAAWTARADGVHVRAGDPPLATVDLGDAPRGRSVHGVAALHRAARERDGAGRGLDWVTVSPVGAPSYAPGRVDVLGARGVATLVAAAGRLPVIALGGISAGEVATLAAVGAAGIAALGVFCRQDRAAARALVAAVEACYGGTGWR